jgi:ABC-2 type transport system ATP-binding protein
VEAFPFQRASDYLRHLALLKGITASYREARVAEVLAVVHLDDGSPAHLSTGMKRRLALAGALLNDPDLLILDEPTAGLDIAEKVYLRTFLSDLAIDRVILLSSHVPEEWNDVADGWIHVANRGVTLVDHYAEGAHKDVSGWRHCPE